MSTSDEAVVRRFYEQMCNERKNEIAPEIFNAGHQMHDPQVPAGDRVVVRWTGSGTHVGDVNGIPPTGKRIRVGVVPAAG